MVGPSNKIIIDFKCLVKKTIVVIIILLCWCSYIAIPGPMSLNHADSFLQEIFLKVLSINSSLAVEQDQLCYQD